MRTDKAAQFWCSDECGMVHVAVFDWDDDGEDGIEFAMFKRGVRLPLSLGERLKHAWYALRGDLWTDEIILEPSEAMKLRNHLTGILAVEKKDEPR